MVLLLRFSFSLAHCKIFEVLSQKTNKIKTLSLLFLWAHLIVVFNCWNSCSDYKDYNLTCQTHVVHNVLSVGWSVKPMLDSLCAKQVKWFRLTWSQFWFRFVRNLLLRIMAESMEFDETEICKLPRKRFYRQRAHSNPIADHTFD